jgi:hypothetical protein
LDFLEERNEMQLYGNLTDLISLDVDIVFYDNDKQLLRRGKRLMKRLPNEVSLKTTVPIGNKC